MILKMKKILIPYLSILIIFLVSYLVFAEEFTIEEAIRLGLTQNSSIRELELEIKNIERDLLTIRASQNWHASIDGTYRISPGTTNLRTANGVNLNVAKTFPSGLTIQPQIVVRADAFPGFSLNISHSLIPLTPTELEKQYWRAQQNLLMAVQNLSQQKINKVISWLETYLSLTRLLEKQGVYHQAVINAEQYLQKMEERIEIGEAGKIDLLIAKISLENARYNMIETEKNVEEIRVGLYQDLGLEGSKITLDREADSLLNIIDQTEEMCSHYTLTETNQLMSIIEKDNYDLMVNRINGEIIQKEKEWLIKEGKMNANISGAYHSTNNEFSIGLNISYNFYDSGEDAIRLAKKDDTINNNHIQYTDIYNQLQIRLKQYINNLELLQLELNRNKLLLEKSICELEVGKNQFEVGLIDYLAFQELHLNKKEIEVNSKSLQDQIFISKLILLKFISIDDLKEVFLK